MKFVFRQTGLLLVTSSVDTIRDTQRFTVCISAAAAFVGYLLIRTYLSTCMYAPYELPMLRVGCCSCYYLIYDTTAWAAVCSYLYTTPRLAWFNTVSAKVSFTVAEALLLTTHSLSRMNLHQETWQYLVYMLTEQRVAHKRVCSTAQHIARTTLYNN